jgi:hypothetical protein
MGADEQHFLQGKRLVIRPPITRLSQKDKTRDCHAPGLPRLPWQARKGLAMTKGSGSVIARRRDFLPTKQSLVLKKVSKVTSAAGKTLLLSHSFIPSINFQSIGF